MTRKEAIKIILSRRNNKKLYERLLGWDESKTMNDNCYNLNMNKQSGRVFINRYHLKFRPMDRLYRKRYLDRKSSKLKKLKIKKMEPQSNPKRER